MDGLIIIIRLGTIKVSDYEIRVTKEGYGRRLEGNNNSNLDEKEQVRLKMRYKEASRGILVKI